jgi:hypothetical protein
VSNFTRSTPTGQPKLNGNIHLDVALKALELGLSPLPPAEDGSKEPLGHLARWKRFQTEPATRHQVFKWYEHGRTGNGLATGYGNLECLEFDDRATYEAFKAAAIAMGLADLVEQIEAGYLEETPGGGFHWFYRCEKISGNTKLAERPAPTEQDPHHREPLIETRGIGGFVVTAPSNGSVHPSGRPYVLLRGGLETIATITPDEREALWLLARTFDEVEPEEPQDPEPQTSPQDSSDRDRDGVQPGADFNAKAKWSDIVEPFGWKAVHTSGPVTYWRRPGDDKTEGWSATTGKTKGFRVFTTSTSLKTASYSRFGLYCALKHQGDWKACVKDLAAQGYGTWVDAEGKHHPNPRPKAENNRDGRHQAGDKANGGGGKNDLPPREAPPPGIDYDSLDEADLGIEWASDIEDEPVEWINENRLASGKLHITAGAGGLGKSQHVIAKAAAITTGGKFPDGKPCLRSGVVIILAAEDGKRDTIKPRLKAAGADMTKVVVLKTTLVIPQKDGRPPLVSFANFQNLAYWEAVFKRLNPVLLIADPVPAFMGPNVNDHRNGDVRRVLEPFVELTEKYRVAIEAVAHIGKCTKDRKAVEQILGSIGYANLARRVDMAWIDPDTRGRFIITNPKLSLGPDQPAIGYTIEGFTYEHKGKTIATSRTKYEPETFDVDEDDLRLSQKEARRGNARGPAPVILDKLTHLIFDLLKGKGPVALGEIAAAAGEAKLLGKQVEDEKTGKLKWTRFNSLYDAIKRIPMLPAPEDGWIVVTPKDDPALRSLNGKARWLMRRADAAF